MAIRRIWVDNEFKAEIATGVRSNGTYLNLQPSPVVVAEHPGGKEDTAPGWANCSGDLHAALRYVSSWEVRTESWSLQRVRQQFR
jgi:hypothetical protein